MNNQKIYILKTPTKCEGDYEYRVTCSDKADWELLHQDHEHVIEVFGQCKPLNGNESLEQVDQITTEHEEILEHGIMELMLAESFNSIQEEVNRKHEKV